MDGGFKDKSTGWLNYGMQQMQSSKDAEYQAGHGLPCPLKQNWQSSKPALVKSMNDRAIVHNWDRIACRQDYSISLLVLTQYHLWWLHMKSEITNEDASAFADLQFWIPFGCTTE